MPQIDTWAKPCAYGGTVGAHDHHLHGDHDWDLGPRVERAVWVAVVAWGVLTLVGLLLLWPGDDRSIAYDSGDRVEAQVVGVTVQPCAGTEASDLVDCRSLSLLITSGPTAGQTVTLELAVTAGEGRVPTTGDELVLALDVADDGTELYSFLDYQRSGALAVLVVLFCLAVLVFGRWKGLGALAGLAVSVIVLVAFVLPALLEGSNPVLVAIVGASIIAYASLYLAHGFNAATNVALLSTLTSLALTGLLAWVFIEMATLTGLSDENALFLDALGVRLDMRGLLLAGIVIGSLGVLDDVTVTQVSAVGALRATLPEATTADLYRRAIAVGRDHVSSTVNTLFLAYAGAALPLLLLFSQTGRSVGEAATGEDVAIEIVRTLVGSIGLIASVPISTWLAASLVSRAGDGGAASDAAT